MVSNTWHVSLRHISPSCLTFGHDPLGPIDFLARAFGKTVKLFMSSLVLDPSTSWVVFHNGAKSPLLVLHAHWKAVRYRDIFKGTKLLFSWKHNFFMKTVTPYIIKLCYYAERGYHQRGEASKLFLQQPYRSYSGCVVDRMDDSMQNLDEVLQVVSGTKSL